MPFILVDVDEPAAQRRVLQPCQLGIGGQHFLRVRARLRLQIGVAEDVGDLKRELAVLRGAEHLARAPELQIFLAYPEAVGRLAEDF